MELLTLDQFIPQLAPFANRELLTPGESSKLSLIITELLLDHNVDFPLLKFLSRFLTQSSYDDIIEERNIEHECGYILCNNSPKQLTRRRLSSNSNGTTTTGSGDTRFQIYNRKPSIILPNTYSSQYCCKEHYQASLFYKNQLSPEALFARKDIMIASPFPEDYPSNWYEKGITCLEEVLAKQKEAANKGKSLGEIVRMMNGLSVEDDDIRNETSELIRLIEDFDIIEKENTLASVEDNSAILDDGDDDYNDNDNVNNIEHQKGPGSLNIAYSSKVNNYVATNTGFNGYVVN